MALQIGDRWAFHSGGAKVIMYNNYWDGQHQRRLKDGTASELRFASNGHVVIRTAESGNATSPVSFKSSLTIRPDSNFTAQTPYGYLSFGPKNSDWCHLNTDRKKFYFSTEVRVDSGKIGSYNENLTLCTSGTSKVTISRSNGDIVFNDANVNLRIPNNGKIRMGPWEMRQTGGGSTTSYFYLDRYTSGGKNNMFRIDWSGNF